MSQEQRIEDQNQRDHSENNKVDVDYSIPAKRHRIVEEARGEGEEDMHHCPREIVTAGMDHKDFQIRQLKQKVASLEGENTQIKEQNKQLCLETNQLREALIKSETLAKAEMAKLREQLSSCTLENTKLRDHLKANIPTNNENVATLTVKTDGCQKIVELKFDGINAHQEEDHTFLSELAISIPVKKMPYPWMRRTFARSLLTAPTSNYIGGGDGRLEISLERKLMLPLELDCELFSWIKTLKKRRLMPELCRRIYAAEGKNVKRKWKSIIWSHWDSILNVSDRTVTNTAGDYRVGFVHAARPILFPNKSFKRRIGYFELKIIMKNGGITFGLSGKLVKNLRTSFVLIDSWGTILIDETTIPTDFEFRTGDVVGCGVEKGLDCRLFFTKNGALGGQPIQLPSIFREINLFPRVSMASSGTKIEAIFDLDEFKFDLSKYSSEH